MKKFLNTVVFLFLHSTFLIAQQPATITPGENLIIKNIPPIPATISKEVKKYTESRSASPVDWQRPREGVR